MGPSSQGVNHFFCPNALPCVRRCSWWVPVVRGANRFFFARTHFLACKGVAGGSQHSGGKRFFVKYGGPSGGSLLSGGGIIIFRVIRRPLLPSWTQLSASPRTVHFRWMSFVDHVDHVDHAAPRAPRRWTTARPTKGTTWSRGRHDSDYPHRGEYEGSLVRLPSPENNRRCA